MFGIDKITYSNLKVKLAQAEEQNQRLQESLEFYKDRLDSEFSKASFSVDWKTMNAFSIERNWDTHGSYKTIIGYLLQEPVVHTEGEDCQRVTYKDNVREWVLRCSAAEHERLVAEFNEYRGKKK